MFGLRLYEIPAQATSAVIFSFFCLPGVTVYPIYELLGGFTTIENRGLRQNEILRRNREMWPLSHGAQRSDEHHARPPLCPRTLASPATVPPSRKDLP